MRMKTRMETMRERLSDENEDAESLLDERFWKQ
jgi:hypothetical protein